MPLRQVSGQVSGQTYTCDHNLHILQQGLFLAFIIILRWWDWFLHQAQISTMVVIRYSLIHLLPNPWYISTSYNKVNKLRGYVYTWLYLYVIFILTTLQNTLSILCTQWILRNQLPISYLLASQLPFDEHQGDCFLTINQRVVVTRTSFLSRSTVSGI